jgi:hypothetical protein
VTAKGQAGVTSASATRMRYYDAPEDREGQSVEGGCVGDFGSLVAELPPPNGQVCVSVCLCVCVCGSVCGWQATKVLQVLQVCLLLPFTVYNVHRI